MSHTEDPSLSIVSIFKSCPNLKSFKPASSYPPAFFSDDDKEQLKREQQPQKAIIVESNFSRYLKYLTLCVPFIDMNQFMEYIPIQQLGTSELDFEGQDFSVWAQKCGTATIAKFGAFLSSVKNVSISFENQDQLAYRNPED